MSLETLLKVKDMIYNLKSNAGISDLLDLLNTKIKVIKEERYEDGNKKHWG